MKDSEAPNTGLGSQPWARMRYCSCGFEAAVAFEDLEVVASADACLNVKLAAHQAAVVVEVIAQHTTTEWGVDYLDGSYDLHEDRQMAEDFAHGGTVVSRLVLPWHEVKA